MKQIPLKQYIEKLVDYNNKYTTVSTRKTKIICFNRNCELIKRTVNNNSLSRLQWDLFNRYMNLYKWEW